MKNQIIKQLIRGGYMLQETRVKMGNQLCAVFRTKLGLESSQKEEEDKEAHKILDTLRIEYTKITDGITKKITKRGFKGTSLVSDFAEYEILKGYIDLESVEVAHFKAIERALDEEPIYNEFLKGVKGCGAAMSGCIISEFDPHKARHVSAFWKYCGYDVAEDGKGRSRKKEHLVDIEYTDKDGKKKTKKGITFNPWLKSKLYVLGTCLIKSKGNYKEIYDGYKHRLENHANWKETSKGHRHNAAIRYMMKIFLQDLWAKWRDLEGLEVTDPYPVAKLGHKPHKAA